MIASLRNAMIEGQIRPNKVTDPRIITAIRAVPREIFVPKSLASVAYIDDDLPIAENRVLIEPMVFARLIAAAEIGPQDVILDIGGGFGYAAAVMAHLCGAVVALEDDTARVAAAEKNFADLELGNAAAVQGALEQGHAEAAPYDVIFINGAIDVVPPVLIGQLAQGGRIAAVLIDDGVGRGVIGQRIGDSFSLQPFMDAHVPALPGFKAHPEFEF